MFQISEENLEWLLNSNPWTSYNAYKYFIKDKDKKKLEELEKALEDSPIVKSLIDDTKDWFLLPAKRHDDPKLSHYKLKTLAHLGLDIKNNHIKEIIDLAKKHRDNGLFAIKQGLPTKGNMNVKIDENFNEWHALPCDSTLITATLYQLGDRSEETLYNIGILKEKWVEETGWFCNLFFVNSQFKKHKIPCPIAGLQALELFSQLNLEENNKIISNAFTPLEFHRDFGKSLYYFGRSKKFWTIKYPFVWYNAFYIAYVLSKYKVFKQEQVMMDIIKWIEDNFDENMRIKATSIFRPYSNWDFGNKKEVSPWLTFLAYRILDNYYNK